jgi:DNA-binding NarL/FixJ family response regulator
MEEKKQLRILLADDHVLFRSGIKSELAAYPHLLVVGEAGDGAEALRLARQTHPHVILLDISMPKLSGLEVIEILKREMPAMRVIILTVHDDNEHLFEAIRKGADGYLLKNLEPSELLDMLSRVSEDESVIDGQLTKKILNEIRHPKKANSSEADETENLTEREIKVLEQIVEGKSNLEIARILMISENTVKMHLSNLLDKLHLENRTQAAVYAVQKGLIQRKM